MNTRLFLLSVAIFLVAGTAVLAHATLLASTLSSARGVGIREIAASHAVVADVRVSRRDDIPRMLRLPSFMALRGGTVSSKLIELSDGEQFDRILDAARKKDRDSSKDGAHKNIIVVDFTATWCMPCKVISPVFRALSESEEFSEVLFVKADVDRVPSVSEKLGVRSMPTFVFFRNGEEVARFSGASVEKLTETLRSLMQEE
jgi:thioredoxin 1